MTEEWRPWPRDPRYQVSDMGRVMGPRGHIMAQWEKKPDRARKQARARINIYTGRMTLAGKRKPLHVSVHIMVCETFHGSRPSEEHQAAHLDDDASNNRASNLTWATPIENQRVHRLANGADPSVVPYKLTDEQRAAVVAMAAEGETYAVIGASFGVSASCVQYHWYRAGGERRGRGARRSPHAVTRAAGREAGSSNAGPGGNGMKS